MCKFKELEKLAKGAMRENGLRGWKFAYNGRFTKTVGRCSHGLKMIEISKQFIEVNTVELMMETVYHEIAHAICGYNAGHNSVWKQMCIKLGGSGDRLNKKVNMLSCHKIDNNVHSRISITDGLGYKQTLTVGTRLRSMGGNIKLVYKGYAIRNRKYPIIAVCEKTGTSYKVSPNQITVI